MVRRTLRHDGFVARRTRSLRPVAALLESDEPRTTRALSEHLSHGGRRGCRAWLITSADGSPAGAVVVSRLCFGHWAAWAYLREPGAATVAADVVERSPAWTVSGTESDIRPLVAHLPRARDVSTRRWGFVRYPVDVLGRPDQHTRVATATDLDSLMDLYAGYELGGPPTRWQLRSYLRRLLQHHFIIVYEDDHRLIGAVTVDGRTSRFVTVNDLTVLPDHRRGGVGWSILARAQAIANGLGVGVTWTMAPSNPIDHERFQWDDELSCRVRLEPPHRFRGEGRVRRMYYGVQPITTRRHSDRLDDSTDRG